MEKHKYKKLKENIIDMMELRELKAGDMIYSENILCEKYGVSRYTVRQALGELVAEGWLYRIQGKGTFVSKKAVKEQVRTIAVLTTYLDDYIFPSIIRGIDGILSKYGYNMILRCTYNMHERETECLGNLISQNIDGYIVEPSRSALPNPNVMTYKEIMQRGIPLLFIHGCYQGLGKSSYIVEDDYKAGFLAAEHLLSLGHTRIGGIFKADDVQGQFRYEGFKKAHMENGVKYKDSNIVWFDTDNLHEEFSNFLSEDKLNTLIRSCSAIVCYNDQIAVWVMDVIRRNNLRIPEDISVVSFDDSQLAIASEIKLTTVAHPKEKLGEEAAKVMIDMIEGKEKNIRLKMQPELIVRSSTIKLNKVL